MMPEEKPVILAVDDTPLNLDLLYEILKDDYQIKVATNGRKALELANDSPTPDLILLDIMMPEMSGYEVCQSLKESARTMPIPVIFITAKSHSEDEEHGLALGAVDYITKPFRNEIVKARLKTHLANYRQRRKLLQENRALKEGRSPKYTKFDERSLSEIIAVGETQNVEFKSTLRWNLHSDKSDKKIENSCLKTVAGFINSEGGVLLVGVDDSGQVVGLERDQFQNDDKLLLHWVNLLKSCIGAEFIPNVRSIIHTVSGKKILAVECISSNALAFFRRDNEEFVYVRMTNTTQALKPSEVLAYMEQHRKNSIRSLGVLDRIQPDSSANDFSTEEKESRDFDGVIPSWFRELKQRHVFRTATIYAAVAWGFTEMSTTVAKALEAPSWLTRAIVLTFVAGFPIVLLSSWLYDLKIIKTRQSQSVKRKKSLFRFGLVIFILISTAVLYVLLAST